MEKQGREAILYFTNGKLKNNASVTVQCNGREETTEILPGQPVDAASVLLPANVGLSPTEVNYYLAFNDP